MNKPHKHLKMLAYQVAGYSSSDTETGFKTFDIDGVRRLQEVDDSENIDFREIDERFVLDAGVRTRYILQYSQLRLQKYRDQLLALFPKK